MIKLGMNCHFLLLTTVVCIALSSNMLSQDTLSYEYIDGSAILEVNDTYKNYYWEISVDTSDMSQTAVSIFDSLKANNIIALHAIGIDTASAMSNYFLATYDSTLTYDSILVLLGTMNSIDTVMRDVEIETKLLGCYEQKGGTAYKTDPGIGDAWWILSPNYVRDQDLDIEEAWEFTRGDQSVVIGVMGGHNWCIKDSDKPKALWHEFGSNIVDGITDYHLEGVHEVPRLYSQTTDGCVAVSPLPIFDELHAVTVMRTIVAHHDTTCCGGTVGVAPNLSIYAIAHGSTYSQSLMEMDYLHDAGCRVVSISIRLPDIQEYRYMLQKALDLDILPVIAAGNQFIGSYYPVQQAMILGPLYVAGNVGAYKSDITMFDDYPKVSLSSAAPGGQTSFASATASAIAGLVLSLKPNSTTSQLRDKLLNSCHSMRDEEWDPDLDSTRLGHGRLSAYRALADEKSGTINSNETWNGPIFVSGDVIIPTGVTVTIDLATLANGVRRTHVRFAGESYTKPVQIIQPKIIVYGTLIVEGEEDERILFSSLQRCIPYEDKYISQWGGIEVKRGGSIYMENALIENCAQGIYIGTDDAELYNVEFCNVGRSIIVQNYDSQYGEPIVKGCEIHNSDGDVHYDDGNGLGIGIWRGSPDITECDISGVNVGVHYFSSYAKGRLDSNYIHNTWSHGILCVSECSPGIAYNRIDENEGYGVSLLYTRKNIFLRDNVISNNGRRGLASGTRVRTGDGILMYNSTARVHANTIDSNRVGMHLQSFSTIVGGDGTVGQYGTAGENTFMENDTTVLVMDHSKTLLGIFSTSHHYGYGNTMNGKAKGMQAVALLSSDVWMQCNTWNPNTDKYYYVDRSPSRIFRTPYYVDCATIIHPYPDDQFELAQDYLAQEEYGGALGIYVYLAETAVDSISLRAINGFIEVYAADSLHQNTAAIDSMLDYVAYYNRNGTDTLKANIAYAQAILATVLNDYDKADSLYAFADSNLTSNEQLRNNLTSEMYLELYMQADTTAALSILQDIESRFANDPLISMAQDMFRYYVDIEANRYIRKQSPSNTVPDGDEITMPLGIRIKQNYPNPFRESTVIPYTIDYGGHVQITVQNILGQTVKVLRDSFQYSGRHQIVLNASNLNPGIYFCIIRTNEGVSQITMSKNK